MDNKLSELKVKIPADKKSRESVAAGYVTDNNSGAISSLSVKGAAQFTQANMQTAAVRLQTQAITMTPFALTAEKKAQKSVKTSG